MDGLNLENFDIGKTLGIGTQGNVYLIRDKKTKELLAYKRASGKRDLSRESLALETIKPECHPYLTCLRGVEKRGDSVRGIATDYIRGSFELAEFLKVHRVSFYVKFTIIVKLLKGLDSIHRMGVVHRDIKTENLLIIPKALEVRYIDFGSACIKTDQECLAEDAGTPFLYAPEVVEKKIQSFDDWKKADIWSLGATFADVCFSQEFRRGLFQDDEEIKSTKDDSVVPSRLTNFVFKDKEPTPQDLFFIKIISLMLNYNPDKRPSTKALLDLLYTEMQEDIGEMTIEEIERKGLEEMSRIK